MGGNTSSASKSLSSYSSNEGADHRSYRRRPKRSLDSAPPTAYPGKPPPPPTVAYPPPGPPGFPSPPPGYPSSPPANIPHPPPAQHPSSLKSGKRPKLERRYSRIADDYASLDQKMRRGRHQKAFMQLFFIANSTSTSYTC